MNKEDQAGKPAAAKKHYYKICPHCGTMAHIDNLYCGKCKKTMKEPGGVERYRETEIEPDLRRHNLDYPKGCPSCGLGCGYCYSYGAEKPDEKARCERCEQARKVCCLKARKLPVLSQVLPDVSFADFIRGQSEEWKEKRAVWHELYAEEVEKCWAHIKAMSELFEKKAV
jgi:ribosomal protein S27AE